MFSNVSTDRTARAICDAVKRLLSRYGESVKAKLIMQTYDGAAVMSGHLNGVQTLVRQDYAFAFFFHCAAHRLNLVLCQSALNIKERFDALEGALIQIKDAPRHMNIQGCITEFVKLLKLNAVSAVSSASAERFFSCLEEYEDHPSITTIPLSETLSDIHITPDEVKNILLSLDDNKATGPDNIPAKLLRCSAPQICSSLCDLFNLSLKCGKIPAAWKISNVVPIPKKGLLKVVSNYRPISLLSIVSKVFERCVYNRLIAHVSINLHHLQFGFLRGKSTTAQLLQVLQEIGEKLDKRVQTDIIYLDFAKAFDRVDHRLLVRKLKKFGIGGTLLKWFEDYLTNRHQRVTVLGKTSHSLPVLSGVPQGSILGPLLFVIYVNDLPQETSTSSIALYADDTKCYRPVRSHKDEQYLQKDLDGINNWCELWRMDLNQSKCEVLSVTRNLKLVPSSYHL
ncbi:Hypothetical predicted protein, partial [Paramuricea clavata]